MSLAFTPKLANSLTFDACSRSSLIIYPVSIDTRRKYSILFGKCQALFMR
jgi:hypothetical protein